MYKAVGFVIAFLYMCSFSFSSSPSSTMTSPSSVSNLTSKARNYGFRVNSDFPTWLLPFLISLAIFHFLGTLICILFFFLNMVCLCLGNDVFPLKSFKSPSTLFSHFIWSSLCLWLGAIPLSVPHPKRRSTDGPL